MEGVGNVVGWFVENGSTVFAAALMIVGAGAMIAKLTPWTEDDKVFGKIQTVLNWIGLRAGYKSGNNAE